MLPFLSFVDLKNMNYQLYRINRQSFTLEPLLSLRLTFDDIPSIHDEKLYVILDNKPIEVQLTFLGESGDDCIEHHFSLRANNLYLGILKIVEEID